tara:strand:+ start:408 stop:578 length:171 start_codon:yes stop_codon:yes gene_type:complete
MFGEMLNKIMSEYPTGDERKGGYSGNDFKVLCANCHRMIHKKNPPLSLEELKKIIN